MRALLFLTPALLWASSAVAQEPSGELIFIPPASEELIAEYDMLPSTALGLSSLDFTPASAKDEMQIRAVEYRFPEDKPLNVVVDINKTEFTYGLLDITSSSINEGWRSWEPFEEHDETIIGLQILSFFR